MDNMIFSFPEFETERLHIVKYSLAFANDAFLFYNDVETMRFAGPDIHNSVKDTLNFIESAIKSSEEGSQLFWAVIEKKSKKMIGDISIHPDNKHRYASMGTILNKSYLKKGIMTEVTMQILNYAFSTLFLNRIEAQICTEHMASIKYVEKFGFKNEGLLRQNFMIDGKLYDSYMYALLKQDYLSRK
jgi:[ribosomal protein S5]-alanine N-acetyltransferase